MTVKCKWFLTTATCFDVFVLPEAIKRQGNAPFQNYSKLFDCILALRLKYVDSTCIDVYCIVMPLRIGGFKPPFCLLALQSNMIIHVQYMCWVCFSADNECLLQAVLSVSQWRWYATIGLTWRCCVTPCHLERVRESYHSFPGALRKICLYRFQYTKNLVHTGRKTHKIQQHATYHRISIPIVSSALPAPRCTWFLKRPGWIILMCTSNLGALRRGRPCDINVLWLSHGFPSHCLWRKPSATPKAISAQLYKNLYLLIKYISVILCVCS